ncbi:MAG: hypothetical protein U0230_07230 [Polyangiales bacterium]
MRRAHPDSPAAPSAGTILGVALWALVAAGCQLGSEPARGSLDDRAQRNAFQAPAFDPAAPLDLRLVRIRPEDHVGQERVCDVVFAGSVEPVTRRMVGRYPVPVAQRKLIRCGSLSGESWADLVFSDGARAFPGAVLPGVRLKVRILAPDGGFEDATVLEFLAVVEGATDVTPPAREVLVVNSSFDFARVRSEPRLVSQRRRCAIAFAGPIRRVTRDDADLYPRGATHHVPVACHHALGDTWVEVVFSSRTAFGALELERGRVVTLEIRTRGGGPADHPFVVLIPSGGPLSPPPRAI